MKHSLFFIMTLGMLPLFLVGCDRSGENQGDAASTVTDDTEREAVLQSLLEADAAWLRSAQVSADSFVSFFADDGLWLYANGSRMTNREEMLAFASEVWSRPGFTLNWEATSVGVTPSYDVGYTAGEWDGVSVAQVVDVSRHPNADRLVLATMELEGERQTVVCGAPNVAVGQKVSFARTGARLIDGPSHGPHHVVRQVVDGECEHGVDVEVVDAGCMEPSDLPPDLVLVQWCIPEPHDMRTVAVVR